MNILVINGPNLNMLGKRQPDIYGDETLQDINDFLTKSFSKVSFEFFQSNHEGKIIDKIQSAKANAAVINAAAYTHYSIAIRDAILSRNDLPFVEVHLSNPKERESFRKISLIEDVCKKTFSGQKKLSYFAAVEYLIETIFTGEK
ncbi:MAG: type II 3-dehydroquinate dehydratase [Bacillota bacterium]